MVSAMYKLPAESAATPDGRLSSALVAGPPSPKELPPPATVVIVPPETFRNAGVACISDVKIACGIHRNPGRTAERGACGRSSVARKARGAVSGHGGDDSAYIFNWRVGIQWFLGESFRMAYRSSRVIQDCYLANDGDRGPGHSRDVLNRGRSSNNPQTTSTRRAGVRSSGPPGAADDARILHAKRTGRLRDTNIHRPRRIRGQARPAGHKPWAEAGGRY
jgi:hypothetical protein